MCRIGTMGEFSMIKSIKALMKGIPSLCVNGIKFCEHLENIHTELDIEFIKKNGKIEDGEMDIFHISCNGDNVYIMFGECKVNKKYFIKSTGYSPSSGNLCMNLAKSGHFLRYKYWISRE